MKKLKKNLIVFGAATAAALSFSACGNRPETVYGPPEYFESGGAAQQSTAEETTQVETVVESDPLEDTAPATSPYTPSENIPEAVYGPPEWFESTAFDPSENIPEDVYGPPEWFGDYEEEEEEPEDEDPDAFEEEAAEESESQEEAHDITADSTESFKPQDNVVQLMYGPPSMLK